MTDGAHKSTPPTQSRRRSRSWLSAAGLLIAAIVVLLPAVAAQPAKQAPAARAPSARPATQPPRPPDASSQATVEQLLEPPPFGVVALVTSYGAMDAVSLCFPKAIGHARATAIVEHMAKLGGWVPVELAIEDERFTSVLDDPDTTKSPGVLQTYVDFSAWGVINQQGRWIALDPFIVPLKEYTPIRLALAVGGQVIVEGPGDYGDNTVQIECNRQPSSIVYDITVKDPGLTSTKVPANPPAGRARAARATGERGSALPWLVGLAVVLLVTPLLALGAWRIWRGKVSGSSTAKRVRIKPGVGAPESKPKSG